MTRRGSIDMNEVERKKQNIDLLSSTQGKAPPMPSGKGYSEAEMELLQFGNINRAKRAAAFGVSKNKDIYLGFV
jgi:hypothetical protein